MRTLSILTAALAAALLPAIASAITCYAVIDRTDTTIYQDTQPPFDLSTEGGPAARNTLRSRKEFLTVSETDTCPVIAAPPGATGYQPATVDEIVSGIRDYAKPVPGMNYGMSGGRSAPAAPARSSAPARKY